jgi:hypothetical protein
MNSRFNALGVALFAVLAMSAMFASAAQAAGTLTTFPSGRKAIMTAEQTGEHEFILTDQEVSPGVFATVKCKKATFTGTAAAAEGATEVKVHPVYTECTGFGLPATVTTAGCDRVWKMGEPVAGGWHVTTDIVCSPGSLFVFKTATCEVTVGSQTGLTTSSVTNSGSSSPETAMDLVLHTSIGGIRYTVVEDGIGCPLKSKGSFSQGDYKGTTTVKAHESGTGASLGITLH